MIDTNTATRTLAQIATEIPAAIPVFERLRLDYCCGGSITLEEACRRQGLDLEHVQRALEAAAIEQPPDEHDWTKASMTELADHIEATHHAFVRDALDRLSHTLPKVVHAHAESHPELRELQSIFNDFLRDMHDHMTREERVLFPWLRRLERPTEIQGGPPWSVRAPIGCMEHDHDQAGLALTRMRQLTDEFSPPPDACDTYRSLLRTLAELERDTHVHIHKENNILFPAGVRRESDLLQRQS